MNRLISHETSLAKTARMLASKFDLKVAFKGNQAGTDGKTIHLPAVSEFLDDNHEVTKVLHGLLDHEVAENIEGDIDRMNELVKNKREKEMTAVVNDAWIEKQYVKRYPGADVNIDAMNDYCLEGNREVWDELDQIRKVTTAVNFKLIGIDVDFVDPMTQMVMAQLDSILEDFPKCESSEDCYDLACRVLEKLEEMSEENDESEEKKGGGGDSGDKDSESQKGSGGDREGEEDTEEEDDKDSQDGDGDNEGEDNSSGDGDEQGEGTHELSQEMMDALKESLEDTPYDDMKSKEELAMELLEQEIPDIVSELGDASKYMPYTTEDDRWEKAPDVPREDFIKLHSEVDQVISPLKRKMHALLMSMKEGGWLPAQEEGRLDSSRLHRMFVSPNAKDIKKQKIKRQDINTAISIWVDHSGSMRGNDIKLATLSCLALAEALQGSKIALQIVGWYEEDAPAHGKIRKASPVEKELYTRWGNNIYIMYKDFDQEYAYARNKIAAMTDISRYTDGRLQMDQNTDGECVKMAAEILLKRPEERKILIMIGDGLPCAAGGGHAPSDIHCAYLKQVCDEVHRRTPVELIAICIGDDRMKEYYPDSIEIRDGDDIPEALLNRFCKLIRMGMNKRKVA